MIRRLRGCLALALLAWGTLGFAQAPAEPCPYLYTGPEAAVPGWMRAIVKLRTSITIAPGYVYNWTVPLRFGGTKSPDNVAILGPAQAAQKVMVENFLGICVCNGQTLLSTAAANMKVWERSLSGQPPFNPTGACPLE